MRMVKRGKKKEGKKESRGRTLQAITSTAGISSQNAFPKAGGVHSTISLIFLDLKTVGLRFE